MTEDSESQGRMPAIPLIGAAVVLALVLASYGFVWTLCLQQTAGHFTYGLDDPYIHLSIAKDLAFHGVWGVTQYAPSSASSSPLWSVLLAAALRIGGNSDLWPLVFGIVCSTAATLLVYQRFVKVKISVPLAGAAALAIFAVGPMQMLPFTGMEHCLQILLDLVFIFWLLDTFSRPDEPADLRSAVVLATLICLCRYESVFLVLVPVVVCVLRKDWRLAAALSAGPVLAVGGFAVYSHLVGMPLVPNSIVIKGNVPHSSGVSFIESLDYRISWYLRSMSLPLWDLWLMAVVSGIAMRFTGLRESTRSLQILIWTVVIAAVIHSGFATVGIFYRYEAYLIVLLATVVVLALREFLAFTWPFQDRAVSKPQWLVAIAAITVAQIALARVFWFYQLGFNLIIFLYGIGLAVLIAMEIGPMTRGRLFRVLLASWAPLAILVIARDRAGAALTDIPKASSDIYLQQRQMARFVARYYPTGRLAANDIGAVTYFSHVHLLDLVGLASDGVARLRIHRTYSTETLGAEIAKFKPDLVIAYPDWFSGKKSLPSWLIPVADWTIPPVTSSACQLVRFYATTPEAAERMHRQLVEFQPSLPSQVKVEYP